MTTYDTIEYVAGAFLIVVLPVALLCFAAYSAVKKYRKDDDSQE